MSDDEIARRRMRQTGEDYATALQYVQALSKALYANIDQRWLSTWSMAGGDADMKEAIAWLRSRPSILHPLMIDFPPLCIVRAKVPLIVPAPHTYGVLWSWLEPNKAYPSGQVKILQDPGSLVGGMCEPDDLEVVGFWCGWSHDRVKEVLNGTQK